MLFSPNDFNLPSEGSNALVYNLTPASVSDLDKTVLSLLPDDGECSMSVDVLTKSTVQKFVKNNSFQCPDKIYSELCKLWKNKHLCDIEEATFPEAPASCSDIKDTITTASAPTRDGTGVSPATVSEAFSRVDCGDHLLHPIGTEHLASKNCSREMNLSYLENFNYSISDAVVNDQVKMCMCNSNQICSGVVSGCEQKSLPCGPCSAMTAMDDVAPHCHKMPQFTTAICESCILTSCAHAVCEGGNFSLTSAPEHAYCHSTAVAMRSLDRTIMSQYFELARDFQDSTIRGCNAEENATLPSFWGRSPLFKSTPAVRSGLLPIVVGEAGVMVEGEGVAHCFMPFVMFMCCCGLTVVCIISFSLFSRV